MKFEPETFFIGIVDFFSIMLPGAVFTSALTPHFESDLFGPVFPRYTEDVERWAVFLFASYLLGHFIFLLGSKLDSWLYDRIRDATPGQQQNRISKGKKAAWPITKWLARKLFSKAPDLAVEQVVRIKQKYVPDIDGCPVINAFQWSKARLAIQCSPALMEVQRFEADSKFFRSLVVVLLLMTVWVTVRAIFGEPTWLVPPICLILAILSLIRYMERRFKATQQAYWYVLILENFQNAGQEKQISHSLPI